MIAISVAIWIIVFKSYNANAQTKVKDYLAFICHNLNTPYTKNTARFHLIEFEKDNFRMGEIKFNMKKKEIRKQRIITADKWDYLYNRDLKIIEIFFKDDRTLFASIDLVSSALTILTYHKYKCQGFREQNIFLQSIEDVETKIKNKKFYNYKDPLFDEYLFRKNELK